MHPCAAALAVEDVYFPELSSSVAHVLNRDFISDCVAENASVFMIYLENWACSEN